MGGLNNRVSDEDRQRVRDIRNPPAFEAGFEGDGGLDDFFGGSSGGSSGFDDMNSIFGTSDGGDLFGSGNAGANGQGGQSGGVFGQQNGANGQQNAFGQPNNNNAFGQPASPFGQPASPFGQPASPFGQPTSPFGQPNSPFGQQAGAFGQPGQMQPQQPDTFDKIVDVGAQTAKGVGEILVEMFKSFRLRNVDDFGFLSRNAIITGFGMLVGGLLVSIFGGISDIRFLSMSGMGGQSALCGGLLLTSGICGIGAAALILEKIGASSAGSVENLSDVPASEDNFTDEFENNIGDEFADLFGDDFESLFEDNNSTETGQFEQQDVEDTFEGDVDVNAGLIDFSEALSRVNENQYISRQTLFNTFKPMFPKCTSRFSEKSEIDVSSDDFATLETICLKALANIANCQLEEVGSHLEKAYDSFFSYELKLKRINKVKKTDDLAREIEAYMKENSDDDSVTATVDIEGDFYKIIVTKGKSAIVTFGDVFGEQYCCDFFLNDKNKLPIITGIDELGKVIVEDAKAFDTMLIAGKPRSGKSWFVLSILMSLMLFNSPEDVQFCIIDPKESNLFKTIALMPHVCGLHNDEHILDILEDIIEIEAPRRKRLLADNRCDDIWALRKKGINLPVLYVVIDEYITVYNNLDKDGQKDFDGKIQTLISQLPSQGIRLIFVPHRATGVVNKTNRTMLQFTAAVRADTADVMDTLGINKWGRALTQPGDIAIKSSNMKSACYVRGAALTTDDGDNTLFIENAAKVFYKMGVDIPDMTNMRVATNRDNDHIKQELSGDGTRIQFNSDTMDNEIASMDFNNI